MPGYTIAFTDVKNVEVVSVKAKNDTVNYCYELPKNLVVNNGRSYFRRIDILFFKQDGSEESIAEQLDEYLWNKIFLRESEYGYRFDMAVVVTTSEILHELYQDFKNLLNDDCCPMLLIDEIKGERIKSVISLRLSNNKVAINETSSN